MLDAVFRSGNIWIDLVKNLLLEQNIASLEYLILTCGNVRDTWVNHDFLLDVVDETQRILWLIIVEILAKIMVNPDLFFCFTWTFQIIITLALRFFSASVLAL